MTPSLPVTRLSSCRRAAAARRSRRRVACLLAVLAASVLIVNQAAAQETAAPAVSDISLSSFPPSDATYQRGDTIEVRVDFDVPVAVTGTPQVGVAIGSQTRAASLSRFAGSRSRAWTLFFGYQVQSADSDTDGVSIAADAIGLNGGTIKDADDDTTDAVLTHAAVAADADHQVDGSRFDVPSVSADLVRRLAGERRHLPARRDDRGEGRVRPVRGEDRQSPGPRWRSRSGRKPGWRTMTTVAAAAAA